ncbi:MAG: hypothetical protein ACYCRD_07115 [Leptospirillum sp.]
MKDPLKAISTTLTPWEKCRLIALSLGRKDHKMALKVLEDAPKGNLHAEVWNYTRQPGGTWTGHRISGGDPPEKREDLSPLERCKRIAKAVGAEDRPLALRLLEEASPGELRIIDVTHATKDEEGRWVTCGHDMQDELVTS